MIPITDKKPTYQIQSYKRSFIPWDKSKIDQSHNLMQIILNIKQKQIIKTKTFKKTIEKQDLVKKQEPQFHNQEVKCHENDQNTKFIPNNFMNNLHNRELGQNKESFFYPQFMTNFLRLIMNKTEEIKIEIKKRKGLCPQKQFIAQNIHTCEYCKKSFVKPCALGGHISKLHSSTKKKAKKQKLEDEWNFITPVKKTKLFVQ